MTTTAPSPSAVIAVAEVYFPRDFGYARAQLCRS